MAKKFRIVLAQLNLQVGDIASNVQKHLQAAQNARDQFAADLIVFPELSITGYPPEDLLFRKKFIQDAHEAVQKIKSELHGIHCVIGHPFANSQGLFNACSMIYNGTILGRYQKQFLPNYGVFDERRYFTPGNGPCVIPIHNIPVGMIICEDLWVAAPTQQAATQGARLIVVPNASPFEKDKHEQRTAVLKKRAKEQHIPFAYVNCIGGQDELVFDGGSMVTDSEGNIAEFTGFFEEMLYPVDLEISSTQTSVQAQHSILPDEIERVYQALVLGTRDYVAKNHCSEAGVLIGLSGGIDSALVLAIAVDALGKDKVTAVMLPSRYTSDMSQIDAQALAKNLGVQYEVIPIEAACQSFLETLAPQGVQISSGVTGQNIQSRCRAVILMALSNQSGKLVLTTGNRSELAVGYCTLYGDMAGAYDVLKDVPKTLVYRLAKFRNRSQAVIPQRIIERAPTAELAANQTDQDTLPPYDVLDGILECYLNQELGIEEIIARGFARETVELVVGMVQKNEYKRKQAPMGPRIDRKSFGRDWRYPVSSVFKG